MLLSYPLQFLEDLLENQNNQDLLNFKDLQEIFHNQRIKESKKGFSSRNLPSTVIDTQKLNALTHQNLINFDQVNLNPISTEQFVPTINQSNRQSQICSQFDSVRSKSQWRGRPRKNKDALHLQSLFQTTISFGTTPQQSQNTQINQTLGFRTTNFNQQLSPFLYQIHILSQQSLISLNLERSQHPIILEHVNPIAQHVSQQYSDLSNTFSSMSQQSYRDSSQHAQFPAQDQNQLNQEQTNEYSNAFGDLVTIQQLIQQIPNDENNRQQNQKLNQTEINLNSSINNDLLINKQQLNQIMNSKQGINNNIAQNKGAEHINTLIDQITMASSRQSKPKSQIQTATLLKNINKQSQVQVQHVQNKEPVVIVISDSDDEGEVQQKASESNLTFKTPKTLNEFFM